MSVYSLFIKSMKSKIIITRIFTMYFRFTKYFHKYGFNKIFGSLYIPNIWVNSQREFSDLHINIIPYIHTNTFKKMGDSWMDTK